MITATTAAELTDEQDAIAGQLEAVLEAADGKGLTISAAARKARTDYDTARTLLALLVEGRMAHTSGNGAWTHYHAGRGR